MSNQEVNLSDIFAIRLSNTLWLYNGYKSQVAPGLSEVRGLDKKFSEYIGISPSYWTRVKAPHPLKNIGDLLARKIERKFRFPLGWLDKAHDDLDAVPAFMLGLSDDLEELEFLKSALGIYRANPKAAAAWVKRQSRIFE
jgi:hypothetical protein